MSRCEAFAQFVVVRDGEGINVCGRHLADAVAYVNDARVIWEPTLRVQCGASMAFHSSPTLIKE